MRAVDRTALRVFAHQMNFRNAVLGEPRMAELLSTICPKLLLRLRPCRSQGDLVVRGKMLMMAAIIGGVGLVAGTQAENIAPNLRLVDPYTITGPTNLLTDYEPINRDGTVNVVVEIPTGTTAKWEVTKPDGKLQWEFKKGKPRVVKYLGYPGNYGMLPRTLLAKEDGGDGDPLDVIVLGEAMPRGAVVKARVVGVLKLLDGGEVDDKIVAVLASSPLAGIKTPDEMKTHFPGVLSIVRTWFENYKGPGEITSNGYAGPVEAMKTIKAAAATYQQ